MSNFFSDDISFTALLSVKLDELELWIKRIEKSKKPHYLHPALAKTIEDNVSDAFRNDFNNVLEDYDLYQILTPKMQTELIDVVFSDFIKKFSHFFSSCE